MRVAVCDDIKEVLGETKKLLECIPYVKNIELYSDIDFLFADICEGIHFDAILMDIDWKKDKNGIDFAADLQKYSSNTKIIYMTSYTMDYVEDIFLNSSNLSGFLKKPVKLEQLQKNLDKVLRDMNDSNGRLRIQHKGTIQVLSFEEIIYLESRLHKVNIYTDTKVCECFERLNQLEEYLDASFLRCHQSYIVNMRKIVELQGKEIILRDGTVIPVSKKRSPDTKARFLDYLAKSVG